MRYFEIPADVVLIHYATGVPMTRDGGEVEAPWSMSRWALTFPLADRGLAIERKDRRAVRGIRQALVDAKPGDIVALEEDHWDRIRKYIEKSSEPQAVATLLEQFAEFEDAFVEARDKCPRCASKCNGHRGGVVAAPTPANGEPVLESRV